MNSAWLVAMAIVAVVICSIVRAWFWALVISELLDQQATTLETLATKIDEVRKEQHERRDKLEAGEPSAE